MLNTFYASCCVGVQSTLTISTWCPIATGYQTLAYFCFETAKTNNLQLNNWMKECVWPFRKNKKAMVNVCRRSMCVIETISLTNIKWSIYGPCETLSNFLTVTFRYSRLPLAVAVTWRQDIRHSVVREYLISGTADVDRGLKACKWRVGHVTD